jgi:hypothetical protein
MHMQKKVTLKEDGRFLIYYHFPDTATEEETRVFEGIQETREEDTKEEDTREEETRHKIQGTREEETIQNPEPVNAGGVTHV